MQIFGHRGSMATHPENTISGFRHAIDAGADGVELDVAVTRDNVLVVTHDLVLKGNQRIVREHRAAELALPTLDQVLAIDSPDTFWFDIEAKTADGLVPEPAEYARLISEAIGRSEVKSRVIVRSFDHGILRAFHAREPDIPMAALIRSERGGRAPFDWVATARAANATAIAPHFSTVARERVRLAHAAGIKVSVWTVNKASDWERMAAAGVDTVVTDDPGAAVRWRAAQSSSATRSIPPAIPHG